MLRNFHYLILTAFINLIATTGIYASGSPSLDVSSLGLKPDTRENAVPFLKKAIAQCKEENYKTLSLPAGRYDFYPDESQKELLFISAHDHQPERHIGIDLKGMDHFTIDGNGSEFVFHGNMLPVSIIDCEKVTLRNFSIDFENPYYSQALITDVTPEFTEIEFGTDTGYNITNNRLYLESGIGPMAVHAFMEFDREGKFVTPDTGDLGGYSKAEKKDGRTVRLYGMNRRLQKGNILFMRNTSRPNPGIFSWRCNDLLFEDIKIHWSQGMGTLSQRCENITMDRVDVCIKKGSDRYFTTIDALHFTACKGLISVTGGLYENMQDDAINVHGDYLQIQEISPERDRITIAYKHSQSFGYESVLDGETVQFIDAQTMLPISRMKAAKTVRVDDYRTEIYFSRPVPENIRINDCVENTDWTPRIIYRNNIIRNNRARGALFSSPRRTVVENNLFDHCSGSAILLSSDCNSWFLSGACHDITIKDNRFNMCMTSPYQYCEAVISVYPEMPEMSGECYHSGIRITGNHFTVSGGSRVLYARSTDGISFTRNIVESEQGETVSASPAPLFYFVNCKKVKMPKTINREIIIRE